MTILVSRGEFSHNWTLMAFGKSFFLGQDVKFCRRVLGIEPRAVVNEIGSGDMTKKSTRDKLAKFIVRKLNITKEYAATINSWDLCAQ